MTRHFLTLLFCVIAWNTLQRVSVGHELVPLGKLPDFGTAWEPIASDQPTTPGAYWHWIVFRNKTTGDLLSLATCPPEKENKRPMVYWSDTALELFPIGRWHLTQSRPKTVVDPISVKVIQRRSPKHGSFDALKYCFVAESPESDNMMAHGLVWVCKEGVLFAQHTSAKPITAEFVEETVGLLIDGQR